MKLKPITVVEIILLALFVIAHFLTYAHVPFMGLVTALSGAVLSMIYLAGGLSLIIADKPSGSSFIFGFAFGLTIIALLFKFQKWPFGGLYIILSVSALLLVAIIKVITILAKKPQALPVDKGIAIRYMILAALLMYTFLI